MYWTPRGRVWEGVSPSTVDFFFEIRVLNTGFLCCASTLSPKSLQMYMISVQGVGKPFLLLSMYWTPRGGGCGGGLSRTCYPYTALLWQKEASDKIEISRKSKMCLSFTLSSMEYHDVLSNISLSRMSVSA